MTEPTKAAKQRACDLANAQADKYNWPFTLDGVSWGGGKMTALAQLSQDISDAAKWVCKSTGCTFGPLDAFILPDESDVLAEALRDIRHLKLARSLDANALRAALAQRGHEITPIKENLR